MAWEARAWKETVGYAAKVDWKRRPMLTGRLRVDFTAYFATQRARDIDNVPKLALDALQGICYGNDSQIDELRIVRRHDPKKPRLEIEITEL